MKTFLTYLLVPLMSISMGLGTLEEGSLGDVLGSNDNSYTTEDSSFEDSENIFVVVFMIFYFAFLCGMMLVWLFNIVFSILMIVDCAKRDFDNKTVWLVLLAVGLVFWIIGLTVSILYFFTVKRKMDKQEKDK